MLRSRSRFLVVLLLICLLGLSTGLAARLMWGQKPRVLLEPRRLLLAQDPLEGEKVNVNLVLRNDSHRHISVLRAAASCACMEMKTWGGQHLVKPQSLPPSSAMPWQLQIDTMNRAGLQHFRVMVECEDKGKVFPVTSDIEIRVRPGMRVEPSALVLGEIQAGQVSESEFMVLDAFPDPGTEIVECRSSDAERLAVRLERANAAETTLGSSDTRVTVRYRGHISCSPMENGRLYHDWITLVPRGAERSPVTLPVIYRTTESEYSLVPSTLVFSPSNLGQKCHREVLCFLRQGVNPTIEVLRKPEYVQVAVRDRSATTKVIEVTCMVPEKVESAFDGKVVFGADANSKPVCSLRIKFLPQ